ncbi:MAG: cobalt transporter CbiM [Victivallales bacterium]
MHISDGILSLPVVGTGIGVTAAGLWAGLRKLDYEKVPEAAVFASAFLVINLIHFPIGMTSAHLVLNGLIGLLFGVSAFPVIFIGLLLQALFLGHGGLLALGVNTMNMALPAVVVYYLFAFLLKKNISEKKFFLVGVAAGFVAFSLSVIMAGSALYISAPDKFRLTSLIFLAANLPLLFLEGGMTGLILLYLKKMKPEIFNEKV